MTTTTIERDGREWLWPADDEKLIQVFDQCSDIGHILNYTPHPGGVCVQAGGACGVWPYYFSVHFDTVYTFEPHPVNFECLAHNAPHAIKFQAALGDLRQPVSLKLHESERHNAGAWYCTHDGDIPTLRIDDLNLQRCDLIQLDVEGWEAAALRGAFRTVMLHRPVVVIEEKQLPQNCSTGNARELLQGWGYIERQRIHRDVLFCYGGS